MLSREEREKLEREGVPYIVAVMVKDWEGIDISNIEMVTDRERQYKGIDYIIRDNYGNVTVVDSKYHRKMSYKQRLTEYGVDVLSIEITKKNGMLGWGVNNKLATDYIIDMIHGLGYYMIDAKRLHEFMNDKYLQYPIMYSEEGYEDYRAVPVAELMEYEVILYYEEFGTVEDLGNYYKNGYDKIYNNNISVLADGLITNKA